MTFVCLSCSKKLSTTCVSSSRTLKILREYLRLCHSFRWVWMVERSRWWSLCVHQLSKHIFILFQWLVTVGLSGWVALEVSQDYITGMGFLFALHSSSRELCQSEPSQEFAWTKSLWLPQGAEDLQSFLCSPVLSYHHDSGTVLQLIFPLALCTKSSHKSSLALEWLPLPALLTKIMVQAVTNLFNVS